MRTLQVRCEFRYPSGFAVNVEFETGDAVTALVGPSGSGKTTTLHLIAGLLTPARGQIALGDRTVFDSSRGVNLPPNQRRVGLVFQDYLLFPHLTVAENLRYGQRRQRTAAMNYAHLLEVLDLAPLVGRYPQALSGGQRQRVALGRAILSGPEVLLLDEPLSASDTDLREAISVYLQRVIGEYRIPTLLVTHDAESVRRLASKTVQIASPSALPSLTRSVSEEKIIPR